MSDGIFTLNCFVLGDQYSQVFQVEIPNTKTVSSLKKEIKNEKNITFQTVDADAIQPYQVSISEADYETKLEPFLDPAGVPDANILSRPLAKLRDLFPSPAEEHIHVIMARPSASKRPGSPSLDKGKGKIRRIKTYTEGAPPNPAVAVTQNLSEGSSRGSHKRAGSTIPSIPEIWSLRQHTVSILYEKVKENWLVQVRGTPGSGKTTLLNLLHAYILSQEPAAVVEVIISWQKPQGSTTLEERLRERIKALPSTRPANTYLLWDNGQDTYWDGELWEQLFKTRVQGREGPLVVLFCSYGSPTYRPVTYDHGTPLILGRSARISLRPDTGQLQNHTPVGLLLSRLEFQEVVERFRGGDHTAPRLDSDLQDMLFDWTLGHVGAVIDLLVLLTRKNRKELREGRTLTVNDFLVAQPQKWFLESLQGLGNFARELPLDQEFQDPAVANVFRKLLTRERVSPGDEAAELCHRHGWIQSDQMATEVYYTFSSPLHATYVAWKLIPPVAQCSFSTVKQMTFAVIKNFRPAQLSSPSRIGVATTDQPLEARYQHEFYRGLFVATGGGVLTSPELFSVPQAHRSGCIDMFIPGKKWGIELSQEGSKLGEHDSRYGLQGAYGAWLTSNDIVEYILLDCRTTMPQKPHPNIANLFHAVFENNFHQVTLLDNMLTRVEGPFALLEA